MASDYNPGILGVDTPSNYGCQELLAADSVVKHGWLRKRSLRNKLQNRISINLLKWPQVYAIVTQKCLYYFNNEISMRPAGAVSLYGFNRIIRADSEKATDNPWAFKLEHVQPVIRSLYFAASSEKEMIDWMMAIKIEMLIANNKEIRNAKRVQSSDESSFASSTTWGSLDYKDLESSIYVDPVGTRVSVSFGTLDEGEDSNTDSDIEETPPALPKRPENMPKVPLPAEYSLQQFGFSDYTMADASKVSMDSYWQSIHFDGSKARAAEMISSICESGVYLIRKGEDNTKVLVLFAETDVRKYKIFQKENSKVTLSLLTGPDFENLEQLLFFYYDHNLPNIQQKLILPYKLHSKYKTQ